MIMICSVDCQFFISVLKKLHPRATCHQSLQNNCCIGSFSCCFGAKVCAYGKCSLICVSAETHSISWILATLEIAPLLCVSSCCRRSFFPLLPVRNLMEVLVGMSDLLMLWSAGTLRMSQKCSCCVFIRFRLPLAVVHYSEPCIDGQLCGLVAQCEHTIPSAHIVVFTSVMSEVLWRRADLCALAEPVCYGKCPSTTVLWVRFFALPSRRNISITH